MYSQENQRRLENLKEQKQEIKKKHEDTITNLKTLESDAVVIGDDIDKILNQVEETEKKTFQAKMQISQSQQIHQQQNELNYQLGMEINAKNSELMRNEGQKQKVLEKRQMEADHKIKEAKKNKLGVEKPDTSCGPEFIAEIQSVIDRDIGMISLFEIKEMEKERASKAEKLELKEKVLEHKVEQLKEEYEKMPYIKSGTNPVTPVSKKKTKAKRQEDSDSEYVPTKEKSSKRQRSLASPRQHKQSQDKRSQKMSYTINLPDRTPALNTTQTQTANKTTSALKFSQNDIKKDKEEMSSTKTLTASKVVEFFCLLHIIKIALLSSINDRPAKDQK
ncbi:myosin heavy chain [Reticulomyxa filosa]|uniref:Myosin heavy chain n=1 Tax=Reticulomyxa filosa TaxID=46433 RepID=X6MZQ7_RETFI|nr:myosin heavy chain [Reticulomyxa filosa]|eukprot:ETO19296.1 myosin heavy chain [Reticulomyxa filosa]